MQGDKLISWFRSLVSRVRFRSPAADSTLNELAARAVTFSASSGRLVRCNRCGGHGPVNNVAVLFAQPLNEGGQRDLDNAAAWCFGCVREADRADYLIVSRVPVERPKTPISVIEC